MNKLPVYLLLLTLYFITWNSFSQVTVSEETPVFSNIKLNKKEVPYKKSYVGKIETFIDSSLYKKYINTKLSSKKYSTETKFLHNIGIGKKLDLYINESTLKHTTSTDFKGFSIVNNSNYSISKVDVESGLSSNTISKTFEDADGNIWIGYTSGEFSKLESNQITNYNNFNQISSEYISDIVEYNGKIWIATFGGGINILNGNSIIKHSKETGLPSNHITGFCVDLDNNLWLATYGAGLIRVKDDQFYHYNNIHPSTKKIITKIVLDSLSGNLWVLDEASNIIKIDNSYNASIIHLANIPNSSKIQDITFGESLYALLENNKLAKFSEKFIEVSDIEEKSSITTIKSVPSGNVWMGNEEGSVFIVKDNNLSQINHSHGLSNSFVSDFLLDNSGNMWISTIGSGIYMTYPSSFISAINEKDDFYINNSVICKFNDNLAFTSKNAVSIINPSNIIIHHRSNKFNNIKGIASDGIKIWLANFDGLYELSNDSLFLYKATIESESGFNSNINVQYMDNKLFVNNYNYSWYEKDKKTDKWYFYADAPNLSFTTSLFLDTLKRKWIASSKGGITYFNDSIQYVLDKNVGAVYDYCTDKDNNIWIGTNSGLYCFTNENTLKTIKFEAKINSSFKSVSYSQKFNGIWIGSNNGLLFLNLDNLTLSQFNKESGINGSSFDRNAKTSLSDFQYWVTNNSIVKFLPYIFNTSVTQAKIQLSDVKLDFMSTDFALLKEKNQIDYKSLNKNIPIEPSFLKNDKTISFILKSNQWVKDSKLNYYYKVSENDNWIGPIVNGEITLSNLPVGQYTLFIKALDANQSPSNIISYEFSIVQPFYKEIWFITLSVGLVILLGIVIFIIRSNFDLSNFKSYSTYTIYLQRLRFLAFGLTIGFPLVEWLTSNVWPIITPNWFMISLISMVGILFIVFSFIKRVSETGISIFALFNSLLITLFLIYRTSIDNFSPLISIELVIVISFSTIVFDNMRLFLIYWIIVVSTIAFSSLNIDYQSINEAIFLIGTSLILFFAFVFHIFQVNRIGKIVFADKILNTYDKLVLVYNKEGEVVYVNPYLNKFFNKDDNFILGSEWYILRNCDEEKTLSIKKDIRNQIETNKPFNIIDEKIYSSLLQSERLIEWTFQIIEDQYLMAIGSDVTTMREQKNRISLLSKVTESVSNGVVIRDANDKVIWCNESFEKLIEYSLADLIGHRPSKFFTFPEFFQSELNMFEENQGNNLISLEIPILKENGDVVWLLMNETVIYDDNGDIVQFISIVSDITENKEKEKEIKELSVVAQSVTNGVIITSPDGKVTWCNDSFIRISGYELDEIIGHKPSEFFKTPDFFKDKLKTILAEGFNFDKSKRIAHYNKKGEVIWILVNTTPIYDKNNKLIQIIEIVTDITEQKNQEEDYERLSLVAQHSQNPIVIMNNAMEIEWVNGAFVKEFGYAESEVIGKLPGRLLKGTKSDLSKFTDLEKVMAKGIKASSEFQLYHKLGYPIWIQASVDPVYNKQGKLAQYICLMQNIQEVKEAQKIIELKNKDITDSINYAKRIQSAILPNLKLVKRNLPEHFMFYRPKDVVSGDFYFMEFSNDKVIVAIADCTGHGVPGAMMTSIGAAGLNNAILDKKLSDPAKIMDHLDIYIKNSLSASAEDLTDGMDIGIIAFNYATKCIEYCGAKRPLILIEEDGNLISIDGIKRSIGEFSFDESTTFVTTEIKISNPISAYCFSDGIPDQFGGSKQKKLYLKKLTDFLVANRLLKMKEQKIELENMLVNWTNNYETPQTDDMVLFGVKITEEYFEKMAKLMK